MVLGDVLAVAVDRRAWYVWMVRRALAREVAVAVAFEVVGLEIAPT